ncbi:GNAT family N-acetyltransferase [Bacillus sp. B-jedd]|uniref:GNAT family N-acetyltransferase n=1 Tax=Bacillus sp. B-jedd TaxID=1476857 RepID=UPI00051565D6|nr:GNAT family N-acetyltransferase [Bacillus sp. B-jedd]CEG25584.1 acetyltransferase [Bacillus sp. B-jedd]
MDQIKQIESLFGPEFHVLAGLPISIIIEQKEPGKLTGWDNKITALIEISRQLEVERTGVIIQRGNLEAGELLIKCGFEHFSSKVDVYKNLNIHEDAEEKVDWRSLESPELTEEQFKQYWEQAMSFSANQPSTLTMDQHLESVRAELGEGWRNTCRVFFEGGTAVGVAIPHMEPGSPGEGRLFYFGILPGARGRGLGSLLHKQALSMLKELGAEYYVGSTHMGNAAMQRVFERNGCQVRAYTESYYIYL